ncbi:efflux RND transporter periplasmic adaptor subunit [Porticoccaceae bacterium]|nr:efflux RND transporter periplasmic adaptor subunit [Porticoccaceae bacterium]
MPLVSQKGKVTLILLIIGVSLIAALALLKPKAERAPLKPRPPLPVDVLVVNPSAIKMTVNSQGTVAPKREIDLVSQVSGRVVSVADNYANGGFFQTDELLVQIEPADYEFAVTRAKAQEARAKEQVALEQGRSRQAKREWRDLGDKTANKLFLRQPQLNAAIATLASARADVEKSKLDLARTAISAPFQGRVRQTFVNIGQYVTPGTRIAKVYGTDVVEVRLPLADRQAVLVDLPVNFEDSQAQTYPQVTLRSLVAGVSHEWQGQVVRTDASIDVQSRMTYAVAEVKNPFKSSANDSRPPLSIGLFVEGQIDGKTVEDAFNLPRQAVYKGDQILVLNDKNEIGFQTISVLRSNPNNVVAVGIEAGTRVVTTRIALAIAGMKVNPSDTGKPVVSTLGSEPEAAAGDES